MNRSVCMQIIGIAYFRRSEKRIRGTHEAVLLNSGGYALFALVSDEDNIQLQAHSHAPARYISLFLIFCIHFCCTQWHFAKLAKIAK